MQISAARARISPSGCGAGVSIMDFPKGRSFSLRMLLPFRVGVALSLLCLFAPAFGLRAEEDLEDLYVARCVFYSDGRVVRFDRMPIVARLGKTPPSVDAERFEKAFHEAAKIWEEASGGVVRFRFADDSEEHVDLPVAWITHLPGRGRERHLGRAVLSRLTGSPDSFHVKMEIGVYDRESGRELTDQEALTVCLHELGHAIGLWGHSDREEDIMSPASAAPAPTQRDADTLRAIYEMPVNAPLHEPAMRELRGEIEERPDDPAPRYLLGSVALDAERYDEAVEALQAALKIDRFHMAAGEKLVMAYLEAERYDEAARQLYDGPLFSAELYNNAGIVFAEKEASEEALKAFQQALDLKPTMEAARRNLARVYARIGVDKIKAEETKAAYDAFRQAWELDKRAAYGLQLGSTLGLMKRHLEAARVYKQVLGEFPDNRDARVSLAAAYNNLGVGASEKKQWERALRYFDQASEADPDFEMSVQNRLAALWQWASSLETANPAKAVSLYQEYLSAVPSAWEAHAQIGMIYSRAEAHDKAAKAYEEALRLNPDRETVRRNLAIVYYKRANQLLESGLSEEAAAYFLQSIQTDASLAGPYQGLAAAYVRSDKWTEAANALEEALRRKPDDEWARKWLSAAAIELGNAAVAREDFEAAVREFERAPLETRDARVNGMLGFLYTKLERYDRAVDSLGRALLANPKNESFRNNLEFNRRAVKDILKRDKSFRWRSVWIRLEAYRLASLIGSKMKKGDLEKFDRFLQIELEAEEKDAEEVALTVGAIQDCALFAAEKGRASYPGLARGIAVKALRYDRRHEGLAQFLGE